MKIERPLTYAEFEACGAMVFDIGRANRFATGDWIIYGERHFSDIYWQAVDKFDLNYGTLRNYRSVAARFAPERRVDRLSWRHHNAVVMLPPPIADALLAQAASQDTPLSSNELTSMRQLISRQCPKCWADQRGYLIRDDWAHPDPLADQHWRCFACDHEEHVSKTYTTGGADIVTVDEADTPILTTFELSLLPNPERTFATLVLTPHEFLREAIVSGGMLSIRVPELADGTRVTVSICVQQTHSAEAVA